MNSAGDNSDVAAYIASRTLRTHVMQFTVASPAWTCGLSALAVIGGYLPRRVNRDGLIAGLEIHGIKLANLVTSFASTNTMGSRRTRFGLPHSLGVPNMLPAITVHACDTELQKRRSCT